MRPLRPALAAIAMIAAVALPHAAIAQPGDRPPPADVPIVAALRPTAADYGATEIQRLSEAQKVREIVENVLEAVTGEPVPGQALLKKVLGAAYLVDVFDCRGKTRCIARVLAPLARRGYRRAIAGDYAAEANGYRFRLVLFQIPSGRVVRRSEFSLSADELRDPKAWSASVEGLFSDRGKVVLATNAREFTCTVDARPCDLAPDGFTLSLPAGEHVIELNQKGFHSASRVVTVEAGREQRVGLALQPLPIQVKPSPSRLIEGVPAAEDLPVAASVIGRVSLTVMVDPLNDGDLYDELALPEDVQPRDWHASFLPNQSFLGAALQGPRREGRWQVRGLFLAGMFTFRLIRVLIGQVQVVREDLGLQITAGRMFQSTVNPLEPGTLSEQTSFGSLKYALTGAKVSKAFGPVVADLEVGKPESPLLGELSPVDGISTPLPFAGGRLAYLVPSQMGELYGQAAPLTIAVSGAVGQQRLGPNELDAVRGVDPEAVAPINEELLVWVGSFETLIPFGPFVLAGEAFVGEGAGIYGGGMFQRPRVDPETGRHSQLRQAGGWIQLSVIPWRGGEVLALGGMDRVIDGFGDGIATNGAPDVTSNLLIGGVISHSATRNLKLSLGFNYIRTEWRDLGTGTMPVGMFDTQLNF